VDSFLTAFGGQNVAGIWTLFVSDNAGGDTGSLGSWKLNIITQDVATTPEPSSLLALWYQP
jgi:subtilisin-like proprotein convertase family protein